MEFFSALRQNDPIVDAHDDYLKKTHGTTRLLKQQLNKFSVSINKNNNQKNVDIELEISRRTFAMTCKTADGRRVFSKKGFSGSAQWSVVE
jgi:hypothetical protein